MQRPYLIERCPTKSLEQFLDATDMKGVVRYDHPVGTNPATGKDFVISAVYFPASEPNNLLILDGGDHGNESSLGESIVRNFVYDLLPKFSSDTGVILIHNANPGARYAGSRDDELGRDIMRCYVDNWDNLRKLKVSTGEVSEIQEKLDPLLNPKGPILDIDQDTTNFYLTLIKSIPLLFEHTPEALYSAGMGGCYRSDRKGTLFYGCEEGTKIPHIDFFDSFVIPIASMYKNVVFKTFHTGIGSRKNGFILIANKRADYLSKLRKIAKVSLYSPGIKHPAMESGIRGFLHGVQNIMQFISDARAIETGLKLDATGSIENFLHNRLHGRGSVETVTAMTYEATTISSVITNTLRLKQQHQARRFNSDRDRTQREIREETSKNLKETFVPSDANWQKTAIRTAMNSLEKIILMFGFANSGSKLFSPSIYKV